MREGGLIEHDHKKKPASKVAMKPHSLATDVPDTRFPFWGKTSILPLEDQFSMMKSMESVYFRILGTNSK